MGRPSPLCNRSSRAQKSPCNFAGAFLFFHGLAMCSSGPKGQTKALQAAQGRANSELRNVAPQGEAAAEAPKNENYPTGAIVTIASRVGEGLPPLGSIVMAKACG